MPITQSSNRNEQLGLESAAMQNIAHAMNLLEATKGALTEITFYSPTDETRDEIDEIKKSIDSTQVLIEALGQKNNLYS